MRRQRPSVPPPGDSPRLAALRLVARRDYTSAEIRERLIARGHEADAVDTAIAALVAEGAVDDLRAATAHVRTSSRIKGRGRLRIRRELETRGVPAQIVARALAEIPAGNEAQAIDLFLARRRPSTPLAPADRQRLFRQLLRRGFSADLIASRLKGGGDGGD